ncbi:hypothetical protein NDU88_001111 [Pleurodeles waltl]|uniref:Uncharacterized protein n=1 Tax=Pleurodeles waltl TaxID=8319 RepID=A0AAV7SYM0_PLEWA|nr:hypothetical protein NDU88_001111 [Pleurodeles waltl]
MTALQADVDSVGTRTLDLETQVQEIKQQVSPLEKEVSQLKSQRQLSILKCEDLKNHSQRDNIIVRVREEGPDLEAFVLGLFSHLLGDDRPEVQIERVHRCGEAAAALGLPETSVDNGLAGQEESRRLEESVVSPVGDSWRLL